MDGGTDRVVLTAGPAVEWLSAEANRATWPLTTCTRAASASPQISSNERHQGGPHTDQTKRHSGNSNISAHRLSPFVAQNGDCARIAL
jgi:hypothetical protein